MTDSDWYQWSRWPGETPMAFNNRLGADYRAMVGPYMEWRNYFVGRMTVGDAILDHGATDVAVRVEPERVRIIYWTPQRQGTKA